MRVSKEEYTLHFREVIDRHLNTANKAAACNDLTFLESHGLIVGAIIDYINKFSPCDINVTLCASNGRSEYKVDIPYYAVVVHNPSEYSDLISRFIDDVYIKYNLRENNHVSKLH